MKGLQKVTFEMVGGLHDVKADIKESMIIPLMRKDVTTRFRLEPPKGILLFGPPGCGKTMLMKALASELGVEMISIKCSDVMSKWYGESRTGSRTSCEPPESARRASCSWTRSMPSPSAATCTRRTM